MQKATSAVESEAGREALSRGQRIALIATFAAYFVVLLIVNCIVVAYPVDNDLDEIGWIVDRLSLRRPDSFVVNQVYPFGFPVILRLLRPVTGSLLYAALAWQAVAATGLLLSLFLLARQIFASFPTALLALAGGAFLTLPVATSEFADGTADALTLAGLAALVCARDPARGFFGLGAGIGLASLFRYHFLGLLLLAPPVLVACAPVPRQAVRALPRLFLGFLATAWPLLVINQLAFGHPLHAGVSKYYPGYFVTRSLDWHDYLATYDLWPVSRLLREQPWALLGHMASIGWVVLTRKSVLAGIALAPLGLRLAVGRTARRQLLFLAALAVAYVAVIILPTHAPDRAFGLVAALLPLFIAPGATWIAARLVRPRFAPAAALALVAALTFEPARVRQLSARRQQRAYNENLVAVLRVHGMRESREVFCNDWNVYNLADPKFISFYNYGGWLLLDPAYADERPPPHATTLEEWDRFLASHGIRYVIIARIRMGEVYALLAQPLSARWRRIYQDSRIQMFTFDPT